MNLKNIETERLILIPLTLEMTTSLISGNFDEIKKIGVSPNANWPTADTKDVLPIVKESLKFLKLPSGFETWMIVKKDNMQVIGDLGFLGKPDEKGEVEIGYGLVKQEHRKGFGFEAVAAIINWAISQECVKLIKASCLITNKPSVQILEKLGMKENNRDNDFIYWQLI